jgi:GTP cyclohydrolase I
MNLPDVQNKKDLRGKKIDWVGIDRYKIPFKVQTKCGEVVSTVGQIKIMTNLSQEVKGVNMSRFSGVVERSLGKELLSTDLLVDMLRTCRDVLGNKNSYIILSFPYFIKKKSPVTSLYSHSSYNCNFCGVLEDQKIKIYLEVEVDYTSLCPCSKDISEYSAHNQRSKAVVRVRFKNCRDFIWIEDIVKIVDTASSCPIYNFLKRPDEKYVTEKAYQKPMFVEDVVREISLALDNQLTIDGYRIEISHQESIHQHNAIAKIKKNL